MWNWLNYTEHGRMVKSWVVVFVSTILTLFMASGLTVFDVTWTDAQAWIAAAVAAVFPLIFNWLNRDDNRYGLTHDEE